MSAENTSKADNSEPASRKCRKCEAESRWSEGFVSKTDVVHGPHDICITCFHYQQKYWSYYWSWIWWTAAAVGLGFLLTGSVTDAFIFAAGAYVLVYLAIVVHEIGHFLAAGVVGVHVPVMSFGGGLRSKVFKLRGMFLILSPTPSEGLIIPAYSTSEHFRKKALIILAGGPLANILAALAGFYFLLSFGDGISEFGRSALDIWVAFNVVLGVASLLPFSHRAELGEQKSDGAQIWDTARMSDNEIDEILEQRDVILASLHFIHGEMSESIFILEKSIENGGISIVAQSLLTAALAESGQTDRGIVLGRLFLENKDLGKMEKAILQNNLAFTLFLTDKHADLEEADTLSSLAFDALPMVLGIRSTRGCVLVAKGRFEEGVALLDDKRFRLETLRHQATVKSIRAQGLAHLGDKIRASELNSAARLLDPSNRHLAAADAAIAVLHD